MIDIAALPTDRPILIAGPTASGKSALALRIAQKQGGVIVNADAIQVFENWRILTARPSIEDEHQVPHLLYGHVPYDAPYSVGHWLREVASLLESGPRPIIIGGTGLYFTALTQGLAEIPPTPDDIRHTATAKLESEGITALLADLDQDTIARIDTLNPMRVQRAWEVQRTTGCSLANWHDNTPPPLLPLSRATGLVVEVEKEWLNNRIKKRFDLMLDGGALDEARQNLHYWDPTHLSSKAIGAPELIAHLKGEITLDQTRDLATIATRQYAKRQRTWFRARMKDWEKIPAESL
ncbi:tRNA (adenosine(37)-N6)-dimethylallyltransferase MiaA [Roseovarius sp. EL26]|uniref:tRNA (adenosine(37)-N6)-dimethylallyltransferase MiaA n=1 Tax=Roseovarius sp. EL26 TaxID=2126672 RepID=UPI000EA36B75|nr:tRNA (adenosine(37)-N6)-dimethylallyltransferase MiaA [Roseovarius sp. EL26]